jgi:hypothetical protein
MVFGALSLFIVVTFTAMVFNVGEVVTNRIAVQNAADASARSAALAEANMISTLAFLNDGMAYIYYDMLRYCTNVTVFGTLAELKETGPPHPSDALIGVDSPVSRYNQAYSDAQEWLPRCYTWLDIMQRMERAIVTSGDVLIRREMRRAAIENCRHVADGEIQGIEAVCLFPNFRTMPRGPHGGYLRLDIDQIDPNNGWQITSNTGYMIEIRRVAPNHWRITSTDGVQIEVRRVGPNHYVLTTPNQELDIHRPTQDHVIVKTSGNDPTNIDCQRLAGVGWAITAASEDVRVSYQPFRDGGFLISVTPPGTQVGVKRDAEGRLVQWDGTEWVPVPGDRDTVEVGGETIPISHSSTINLPGNATLHLPNRIRIGAVHFTIPDSVQIAGTGIQLIYPDSVRITATVGPAKFVIDDTGSQPHLVINGLTTADADGIWRVLGQMGTRHRLTQPDPADNFWIYEHAGNAAHFYEDSIQRLARHAVFDNDPVGKTGATPAWTEWFNPTTGQLVASGAGPANPGGAPPDEPEVPPGAYAQSRPSWDDRFRDYQDADGNWFVRRYPSDMINKNEKARPYLYDSTVRPYISIDLNRVPRPLRLTDDFLKFGFNVAVWRDKNEPALEGSDSGALSLRLFQNPPWGYFAVASARCAFLDNTSVPPDWRETFATRAQIRSWVETSFQNLYEPVWTAKLVSTREAIITEHLKTEVDDQYPGLDVDDSGTVFMWKGLAGHYVHHWSGSTDPAVWHNPDPPEEFHKSRPLREDVSQKFRNMRNRDGGAFNYRDTRIEEVIDH